MDVFRRSPEKKLLEAVRKLSVQLASDSIMKAVELRCASSTAADFTKFLLLGPNVMTVKQLKQQQLTPLPDSETIGSWECEKKVECLGGSAVVIDESAAEAARRSRAPNNSSGAKQQSLFKFFKQLLFLQQSGFG